MKFNKSKKKICQTYAQKKQWSERGSVWSINRLVSDQKYQYCSLWIRTWLDTNVFLFSVQVSNNNIVMCPFPRSERVKTGLLHICKSCHFLLVAAWRRVRLWFINGILGELGLRAVPWLLLNPLQDVVEPVLFRLTELPPLPGLIPTDRRLAELSKASDRGERDVWDLELVGGV